MAAAIRCTLPSCTCECFAPGKSSLRVCETCKHGWVAHALDKLGFQHIIQLGMSVEVVQPNIVFDIASLMLYGTQATPIRLKILLDRLFSVLQHDEVLQVLHGFGWSYEDYARGYILQDASGRVLDKWSIVTREEEDVIIQQFLRFGETRAIAQEIIIQGTRDKTELPRSTPKTESEIKKFIERNSFSIQSYMRSVEAHRLLGGKFVYPHGTSAAAALIGMPQLGSFATATAVAAAATAAATTTSTAEDVTTSKSESTATSGRPATSPLNQLQSMQAFDYRIDRGSRSTSPASSTSERQQASSSASHSPQSTPTGLARSLPLMKIPQMLPITPFAQNAFKSHFNLPGMSPGSFVLTPTSESQDTAINYSTKDSSRDAGDEGSKLKHLRKSSMPLKRNWTPSGPFGHTFISPSGKKRVLCTVCNKTFCDKGALKIHYSAVHLKEMHKCTVDGCNMMFSSRRSRNRHSANPNPKLHQPQKRKIPDGATIVEDGKISSPDPRDILEIPATSLALQGMNMNLPISKSLLDHSRLTHHSATQGMSSHHRFYLDDRDEEDMSRDMSPKRLKIELPDEDEDEEGFRVDSEPETEKAELAKEMKEKQQQGELTVQRGTSKRKRLVPTRCAQSTEEDFVMSDDNSDHEMQGDEAIDCGTKEGCNMGKGCSVPRQFDNPDFDGDNSNDVDRGSSNESPGEREDISFLMPEQIKKEPSQPESNYYESAAFREIQERAIKQMYGIPCDSSECDKPRLPLFSLPRNLSEAGRYEDNADGARTPATAHSDQDSNDNLSSNSDDDSPSPIPRVNGQKSPQSPTQEDLFEFSGLDIPVDQENPKKCPACGKVFQNTFTVKTHYQSVHLRLMHTCTIEGCNAAFPSKRSRNRHSGNLNLHRKLLSTSTDTEKGDSRSLRDEFLARIYDSSPMKTNHNGNDGNHGSAGAEVTFPGSSSIFNTGYFTSPSETLLTAAADTTYADADNGGCSSPESENCVKCHICNGSFRDNLVLKEHFEKVHPKDMYKCTVHGCDKIFSTRKSRNRHSQNDNLHKHISPKI